MKPYYFGLYAGALLSLSLAVNPPLIAQEGQLEKLQDLVPADLKVWTIEFFEKCEREGSEKAILDSQGNLRVQYLRRSTMTEKKVSMPDEVTAAVFQSTRQFFNHYQLKDLPRTPELDVQWVTTVRDEQGRAIQIEIDAYKVRKSPDVLRLVHLARKTFGKHGFGAHGFRYEFDPAENEPLGEPPSDRLPVKPSRWLFAINYGAPPDVYPTPLDDRPSLWCSDLEMTISGMGRHPKLELLAADQTLKQKIAGRIMNRFQLRNRSEQNAAKSSTFDVCILGDTDVTLTCDRQTLIDAGVLDELDAWIKDINRRLAEQGLQEQFLPPWSK